LGKHLYRYPDPRLPADPGDFGDVWCLGDSHTQGAGAPPGMSYPQQLEGLLSARQPTHVLNLGYGGTNTSQQLHRLRAALSRATPKTLIYMGGINNGWKWSGVDWKTLYAAHGPRGVAQSFLQRSRTYKFLFNHLLAGPGRQNISPPPVSPEDASEALMVFQQPDAVLQTLGRRAVLSDDERFLLATAQFLSHKYPEALANFRAVAPLYRRRPLVVPIDLLIAETRRLAEAGPPSEETVRFYSTNPPAPDRKGRVCFLLGKGWMEIGRGNPQKSREFFKNILQKVPDGYPFSFLFVETLGWSELLSGDLRAARAHFKSLEDRPPFLPLEFPFWSHLGSARIGLIQQDAVLYSAERSIVKNYAEKNPYYRLWADELPDPEHLSPEMIQALNFSLPRLSLLHHLPPNKWAVFKNSLPAATVLTQDLDALAGLARKHGFRLVLMGYPFANYWANDVLRDFAMDQGIPFIDLHRELGDFSRTGHLSADRGHPNQEGYRRIAETVRRRLSLLDAPGEPVAGDTH